MSGLYGCFLNNIKVDNNQSEVEKLHSWNSAYGADDIYTWADNNVFLGCCVEHFTKNPDLKKESLSNKAKKAVVDAVIYNRDELCKKNDNYITASDEEMLFSLICREGFDSLRKINGDFSGAVFDENEGKLTLFRDHIGVRPLFYYSDDKMVVFSSDIRGIIAFSGTNVSIDEEWLYKKLSGYVVEGRDKTEFQNIKSVLPATYITFSFGKEGLEVEQKTYWQLGAEKIKFRSFELYKKKLRELVEDSVVRRLNVVNGKVAAELSGGLDSGVIDLIIASTGRECFYHSWSEDPAELKIAEEDERLIVEDLCKKAGIVCHFSDRFYSLGEGTRMYDYLKKTGIPLPEDEHAMMRNVFPEYVNTLPIYATAEYVRKNGARVIFSGHGGDEGVSHRAKAYEILYNREYCHFIRQIYLLLEGKNLRLLRTLKYCFKYAFVDSKKYRKSFVQYSSKKNIFREEFFKKFNSEQQVANTFNFDVKQYIEIGGTRRRLDITALLGGFGGVRYVFPFLDHRVIDYAVSIPRYLYLNGNTNRYIFREAFKDIMPESLYTLDEKSNNSRNSYKKEDQSEDEKKEADSKTLVESMKWYNERMDWNYWSKYLNEEVIDTVKACEKPVTDQQRERDHEILQTVGFCYNHQNLVVKLRGKMA